MANILVVEDEAISAMAISEMLESTGHTVVGVVASGRDAIDHVAQTRPDVVLMDVRLKGEMSGIEAAKSIQTDFRIPIIFTTAYSAEDFREYYDVEDSFVFVTKPIREDDLAKAVHTTLSQGAALTL